MKTDTPILNLIDDFLTNLDVRDNSRKKYSDSLQYFIKWITINGDVRNVVRKDILNYKRYLLDAKLASMTVDNYLVPVRQFYKHLEETGIADNIAAGIHVGKKYYGYRKDYLRPHQVSQLLSSINRSTPAGMRNYAIINLMVRTGMRCIEVARLDVKDLTTVDGKWIISIQRKGHWEKDGALGLTLKVVAPIAEYITENELSNDSPMFINHCWEANGSRITTLTISKIIKAQLRAISIDSPRITAHSLRHTAAITALNSGATIYEVQQMLGHRSVETTQIYLRAIEAEKGLEGTAVRLLDSAYEIQQKTAQESKKNDQLIS